MERPAAGRNLSGERWGLSLRDFPVHRFPPGSEIQRQGERPAHVFVLRAGWLKLLHGLSDGRSTIVALRSAPFLLGLEAALLSCDLAVSAVTLSPCQVIQMPAGRCLELAEAGTPFARFAQLEMCREHQRQLAQIAGLARLTARERLEGFLHDLNRGSGSGTDHSELPLKDWELAQLLAITPPYLSRLMHELVSQGWLERRGSHWVLVRVATESETPASSSS